jgi:hypothetical protein
MIDIPGSDSARKAWDAAEKEDKFWQEHYDRYLKQFPDQFVAVAREGGQIVATDPDLHGLIQKIESRGLQVQQVWSRFMYATPIRISL